MSSLGRLLVLCSIAAAPAAFARDKTDVVVLLNGDRVTGEIKQLEYGLLQLSTDNMGTLSIEWAAIASIESAYTFDVERTGGQRSLGTITTSDAGGDLVVRNTVSESIPLPSVVRVRALESGFWARVSGSLSLGLNYTKSSGIRTSSINVSSAYQAERLRATLDISSIETSSPDTEPTAREQISSTVQFRRDRPAFLLLLNSIERNEELGIERRLQSGAGLARYFLQGADREVMAVVGATATREWTTGVDTDLSSLEGVLGAQWRIFRFSDPEISLSSSAYLYPSLTESGRLRGNLDVSWRREIISDFFFDISLYDSYDSDPPSEGTTSDYGVVTSFGYKF
jgi:hypothetical protein